MPSPYYDLTGTKKVPRVERHFTFVRPLAAPTTTQSSEDFMGPPVREFLSGIIDYAGLFPPARLPFGQAIRNYARYGVGEDSWMLGRFVCPAAKLGELEQFSGELIQEGKPLAVAALGRGGATPEEFLAGLQADLDAIALLRKKLGPRATVDVLETRLPAFMLGKSSALCMHEATNMVRAQAPYVNQYFEIPIDDQWREAMSSLINGLSEARQPTEGDRAVGFKLRTGGLEAAAFPSTAQVVQALKVCRDKSVPFKATAGLHHPIRQFDADLKTMAHGFLNVFGAGILAYACNLREDQIAKMIEDESAENFVFSNEAFKWNEFGASTAEITAARREMMISFGSCSFEEPRDDMRALGWI